MLAKSLLKITLLLAAALLLSQCTKVAENQAQMQRANQQATTPYSLPASAYLALAKNQVGEEQQQLLLMAAGRQIYDGQWQEGLTTLAQTSDYLPPALLSEKIFYWRKQTCCGSNPNQRLPSFLGWVTLTV